MSKTIEYLKQNQKKVRPWMEFKDLLSMSVQHSSCHYCQPREDNCTDEIESVEVLCPFVEPLLDKYRVDGDVVYGCVPVKVVDEIIEKHGGLV